MIYTSLLSISKQFVDGLSDHVQYQVLQNLNVVSVFQNPHKLPWSTFVGALGMAGQTAWMGWKEFSKAKKVCMISRSSSVLYSALECSWS